MIQEVFPSKDPSVRSLSELRNLSPHKAESPVALAQERPLIVACWRRDLRGCPWRPEMTPQAAAHMIKEEDEGIKKLNPLHALRVKLTRARDRAAPL